MQKNFSELKSDFYLTNLKAIKNGDFEINEAAVIFGVLFNVTLKSDNSYSDNAVN